MPNLFVIYTALSVFGIGITIIDFLGILEHSGNTDSGEVPDGNAADANGDDAGDSFAGNHGDDSFAGHHADDSFVDHSVSDSQAGHHESDSSTEHHGSYLSHGQTGIRAVTITMTLLRTTVYFSLGFGPTGLFAWFRGFSRGTGFIWALGVGAAITAFAWVLRRFIRHDLDSSISSDEFLMEKGILLLPLEGDSISKIVVKRFGQETELYVKSRNAALKLAKGKTVRIVDYDKDIYWIEPAE